MYCLKQHCGLRPDFSWCTLYNKGKAVPLEAWSGPEGSRKLRFPDFISTAQDGGKVSLTHRLPLPPGNAPGTHFRYRLSRPQGHSAIRRILCQWKIPVTPAGIEPATFRFVAQHLNHCVNAVPILYNVSLKPLSSFRIVTDRKTDGGQIRRKRSRKLQNRSPESVLYHCFWHWSLFLTFLS